MDQDSMRKDMSERTCDPNDLKGLLHPALAFAHPSNVLDDLDLTLKEKRAILASWASDACAVEAAPDLRSNERGAPVLFDDIMKALRTLDRQASDQCYRRVLHPGEDCSAVIHEPIESLWGNSSVERNGCFHAQYR
jgi:hypothetical protein